MENNKNLHVEDSYFYKEILPKAANLIDKEAQQEIREHENQEVEIPAELDQKFLKMARAFDAKRNAEKRKKKFRHFERMVACVLVCVISAGAITMGVSEAFRKKVFHVFSNEKTGSMTLINDDERQMIGSWENYWYPSYLPNGFELIAAEEVDHFLLFKNTEKDMEVRICELESNTAISVDTDTTDNEKIMIGYHDGYLFSLKEKKSFYAIWLTDEIIIKITFEGVDKNEVLKIINNLDYIEKSRT